MLFVDVPRPRRPPQLLPGQVHSYGACLNNKEEVEDKRVREGHPGCLEGGALWMSCDPRQSPACRLVPSACNVAPRPLSHAGAPAMHAAQKGGLGAL